MNYSNIDRGEWTNSRFTQTLITVLEERVISYEGELTKAARNGSLEKVRYCRGMLDAGLHALALVKGAVHDKSK